MKIWCVKSSVLKKNRYKFSCPSCNSEIILDKEVFEEHHSNINCYQCNTQYNVVSYKFQHTLILEILPHKESNIE